MKTIFFLLLFSVSVRSQISPGDLSTAHSHLEGISNCTACHEIGAQVSSKKCLNCHKEIQSLLNSGRGYHSGKTAKGKECWTCHNEHHGKNFRIIKFNTANFNHSETGFILTGTHSKTECRECHQSKYIADKKISEKKNTYLGLSRQCSSCHSDYHQGTLSQLCSDCHTTDKFKPAPKFSHDGTKFKLTGAHSSVSCFNCHPKEKRNGKDFQKFTGIAFNRCTDCHKDIHHGKFGSDCLECHSTSSFSRVSSKSFNHNKTGFPLRGNHLQVDCKDCHRTSVADKIKHDRCTDCHENYHKDEFTDNNRVKDCSQCHTENKFKPSLFTIEDHQESRFKLEGAHLAVPCQNCHLQDTSWKFRSIGLQCINCHENVHRKEITEKYNPITCTNCHNFNNWITINFDHNLTDFKLEGRHSEVRCSACHFVDRKEYKFASLKSDCKDCHDDIHYGQFIDSACSRCHTFFNWKPDYFDHSKTRFPLTGAHAKIMCSDCHKKVTKNNKTFILYKIEKFKCSDCHS